MFIPDPDFYPSRIPDLGSRIQKLYQKREMKKNFVIILFSVEVFTQQIFNMLSNIWDARSGKKPIPDPGSVSTTLNFTVL
jgi:hypothetical protein